MDVLTLRPLRLTCGAGCDPALVQATIMQESHAHPSERDDTTTRHRSVPATWTATVALVTPFLQARHRVALGVMQGRSAWFSACGRTVQALLDPYANIAPGAAIAQQALARCQQTHLMLAPQTYARSYFHRRHPTDGLASAHQGLWRALRATPQLAVWMQWSLWGDSSCALGRRKMSYGQLNQSLDDLRLLTY